jgi:predicted aldo/keto reductase-like oxidoreductase
MEKRRFGKTGLETTVLGFGGFHLCEIPYKEADDLLNAYLNAGGNYIETAPSYGNGESEIKIGRAVSHRRNEFILVTKAHSRDYEACKCSIEQSLMNLKTDFIDVLLMHAVGTIEELEQILSENGAIKAAEEAKKSGKIRHIGISMHGQPDVLVEALNRYDFEAVMTTINYFDHCNFPSILNELVPLAEKKDCAVILMKALADGYLYRNPEKAFQFAFAQSASVVVAGINAHTMLDMDLALLENHKSMTSDELDEWMHKAPELGSYVCRQCGTCKGCPENIDIPGLFLLEAIFDRQMGDGNVADAGIFALKERLKHWFGTQERAKTEYAKLDVNAKACTECGLCLSKCTYGIDIISKLKNVDYKLDHRFGKIFE